VQILVVVANTQENNESFLRAKVGKGFKATLIGFDLLDPKWDFERNVMSSYEFFGCVGFALACFEILVHVATALSTKGKQVKIPVAPNS